MPIFRLGKTNPARGRQAQQHACSLWCTLYMNAAKAAFVAMFLVPSWCVAADTGWLAKVPKWATAAGIIPMNSGAVMLLGDTVVTVSSSGQVQSAQVLPSVLQLNAAGSGLCFIRQGEAAPFAVGSAGRMRPDATIEWSRSITEDENVLMKSVGGFRDGSVVAGADIYPASLVIKFSAPGEVEWQRRIDYSDVDDLRAVVPLRDGGVLVLGATAGHATAVRLTANGDAAWHRAFTMGGFGIGFFAGVELPNGDLIVAGRARAEATNDRDAMLARLTAAGDVTWQKLIGGGGEDAAFAITAVDSGRFAVLGTTRSVGQETRGWLLTFGPRGELVRQLSVSYGGGEPSALAIASAKDDSTWFAIGRPFDTLIGRLTTNTMCDALRPTAFRTRDVKLVPLDQPVEIDVGDARTSDERLQLRRTEYALTMACAAPGPATAEIPSEAIALPDETRFSRSVAQMFVDRKFAELDALADKLRRSKDTFDSGSWMLRSFYDGFTTAQPPLTALGRDACERLFERWHRGTRRATSRVALAQFHWSVAWQERGSSYTDAVTRSGGERYTAHIAKADQILETVLQQNECDPECLNLMIRVENLGGWSPPLRKLLETEPGYWHAYASAAGFLRPQWGGAPGALEEFARQVADATHLVLGDAAYMKAILVDPYLHAGSLAVTLVPGRPRYEWSRLRKGFEAFQARFPRSRENLAAFASFALQAGDRPVLQQLLNNPLLVWQGRDFESAQRWAFAQEPVPTSRPLGVPLPIVELSDLQIDSHVEHTVLFEIEQNGVITAVSAAPKSHPPLSFSNEKPLPLDRWRLADRAEKFAESALVPSDPMKRSRIVLFPASENLLLTTFPVRALAVQRREHVTVIACRTTDHGCAPVRIPMIVTAQSGNPIVTFRVVSEPGPTFDVVAGAPVLDNRNSVVGVVGTIAPKTDDQVLEFLCESIGHVLSIPRVAIALNP